MSALRSPINEEKTGEERSFERGAITGPPSVPSDSFILSFRTNLGNTALCQGVCSTQQKSTTQAKDGGKFALRHLPQAGLARGHPRHLCQHLGQRWLTVQDPESKETFHSAGTSPWSQRVADLAHAEGVCPLSLPADPPPWKS